MKMTNRSAALSLLGLGALASFVGCGLGAGDYTTYRIGSADASLSGDCTEDENDSTTFRSGGTFLLYYVAGDDGAVPYLDGGGNFVLQGEETDEGYTFTGKSIDAEEDNDRTFTTTTTATVTIVVDGDTVSGTAKVTSAQTCSGTCGGFDDTSCTSTSTFDGVEVDDSAISIPEPT